MFFLILVPNRCHALLLLLLMQLLLLVKLVRLEGVPLGRVARLGGRARRHLRKLLHVLYDLMRFLSFSIVLLVAHNFIQIFYCAQLSQFIHLQC